MARTKSNMMKDKAPKSKSFKEASKEAIDADKEALRRLAKL